jgi:hypothetical protein
MRGVHTETVVTNSNLTSSTLRASQRTRGERGAEEWTTTGSSSDHGGGNGVDLPTRAYYRLRSADRREFEPNERFFDQLESAFIWAYLGSADEPGIPSYVYIAIEEARSHTVSRFTDRPDADLNHAVQQSRRAN